MNGKGDARRPTLVDRATLEENWERTFGEADCHPWRYTPPSRDVHPPHDEDRAMPNAAQQITTDASYDADLEIATEMFTARYDASGSPEGEAEKAVGDKLNNAWVEGITIAEWVERAAGR